MNWLINKFWEILEWFGLPNREPANLIFLGLGNAGKTTLLSLLRINKIERHAPTIQPNMKFLKIGTYPINVLDLGGHTQARRSWDTYLPNIDAIIFLVDATDKDRFSESRDELQGLLDDKNGHIQNVPILVLGNKIDLDHAVQEEELRGSLNIDAYCTGKDGRQLPDDMRPLEVFMCTLVQRQGYKEGIQWLLNYVS